MQLLFITLSILFFCIPLSASENPALSEAYISAAIQGDLKSFSARLESLDPARLTAADRLLIEQFDQRFVSQDEIFTPQAESPLLSALLPVYRKYWTMSLMGEQPADESAQWLIQQLRQLPGQHERAGSAEAMGEIQDSLRDSLESEGFHYLMDEAPPLQDLFIWRTQESREYPVRLTDQTRTVRVNFMDDFELMGWKFFASLGLASTTGWVHDGELYCVAWAYDRSSERFRVSYLQHEARHLADYEKFPGLESVELEYRAKLTELAYAFSTAHRILDDFTAKSARNPDSPHAMANYRLTRALHLELFGDELSENSIAWEDVSTERINRAARELLKNSTEKLIKQQES